MRFLLLLNSIVFLFADGFVSCSPVLTPRQQLQGTLNFEGDSPDDAMYTQPLVKDIETLSSILGTIIKTESLNVHGLYETLCTHALARSSGDNDALEKMKRCVASMTAEETLGVTRAFTQTLNLINAAEVHHRMRYLRGMESEEVTPLSLREDSVAGAINNILRGTLEVHTWDAVDPPAPAQVLTPNQLGQRRKEIFDRLLNQQVEIVYTAHPTEVNRRTLLRKYRYVSETLAVLDRRDLTPYERQQTRESLSRVVASIWGSDEIRRDKPSPQQEAKGGLAIVETVLWDAVPSFYRRLSAQCALSLDQPLPLTAAPVRFASWMGGDRDGNPNVTPAVTREVATTQRLQAARLYLRDLDKLYSQLAVCKGFTPEMLALAREVRYSFDRRELYRRVIGHLQQRLLATVLWCEAELNAMRAQTTYVPGSHSIIRTPLATMLNGGRENIEANPPEYDPILGRPDQPMLDSRELTAPLLVMHQSLCSGGFPGVADGLLTDILRRVSVFGLTLCPLDLRQESGRHTEALDALTRYLGVGSYAQWDEQARINWLQAELAGRRPLLRVEDTALMGLSPTVLDTLRTLETAAALGPGSLGAYVISQAHSASDVLAVLLLQKQYGMTAARGSLARVVPLFETLADLTNAPAVLDTLFGLPGYIALASPPGSRRQEVMIGYSDSAKDAGRLAAGWAQYESQEKMVLVAERHGVQLTFFHGKGGTVGRGGNPALYRAVLAHPPRTINGRFRVTEQGEMITQNFGSTGIAERTMDIYTAAVLAEQFAHHVDPKPEWRQQMRRLSDSSRTAYQQLIARPSFIRYFRRATPEVELGSLNIGSRPAKRNPAGGIESLRAIPWTFAWSQTRLHLPAWCGVAEALCCDLAALKEMYRGWPFFRETCNLVAMTLSKADAVIALNYEEQLIGSGTEEDAAELRTLGAALRASLAATKACILAVTGSTDLSCGFKLLQRSMRTRYPYVDPLNVIQAEALRRLRASSEQKESTSGESERSLLEDALIVSINGISQGMKNSG